MCHWSHFQIKLTILIIPKDFFLPFYCYNYGYFLHCGKIIFFLFLLCFLLFCLLFLLCPLLLLPLVLLLFFFPFCFFLFCFFFRFLLYFFLFSLISLLLLFLNVFKTSLCKSGQFVTSKVDFSNTTGKRGELVGMPLMQKDTLKSWKSPFW